MPKEGKEPRGYDSGPSDSKIRTQSKLLSALIAATGRVYEDIPLKKIKLPLTVTVIVACIALSLWSFVSDGGTTEVRYGF